MTANQARRQSEEVINFNYNSQYNEIVEQINYHSNNGTFFIFYYKKISNEIIEKLTKDGFTIEDISNIIREVEYKISW